MNKREKIIVAAMAAAVAFGAYSILFDAAPEKSMPKASAGGPAPQQFVMEILGQLKKADANAGDAYLIDQAQARLTANPFYRKSATASAADPAADAAGGASTAPEQRAPAFGLSYTGFVEMGDKRLAILNGREYAEGDTVDTDGKYLKTIAPSAVVIGVRGKAETTTIAITETN